MFSPQDRQWMRRSLALAARGRGRVEPNPMVGCVLVKDAAVIAEGYHRQFGGPHAEVDALRQAGERARGSTAYVTLEPCCHIGKTGPCTDALLAAGVARVIAAMADPFPQVAGKGLQILQQAGMQAAVGLCEQEARQLNAPYLKRLATGRPWVILKWAQSLDGKMATQTGRSQWITGPESLREAHRIRSVVDAVVVGAGTVAADDPQLTSRLVRARRVARRVVVDGRLRIGLDSRLVRTARDVPVTIASTQAAVDEQPGKVDSLRQAGCEVLVLPTIASGRVDLGALLDWFGGQKATNVMVEGGGHLLGQFLDQQLADEVDIFIAPMLIGGGQPAGEVAAVTPWPGGVAELADSPRLDSVSVRRFGADLCVRGYVQSATDQTRPKQSPGAVQQ
jgi:diaminohydroxyphosphoribosylaminopyrimidine deaminase/5-amino-6-(5-phosphoribosylamino)uracil reductase